jgi:hypothetical protein
MEYESSQNVAAGILTIFCGIILNVYSEHLPVA